MASTVSSIPKATRKTKYDYDTLFNGEVHRYVRGEDFTVTEASFRGALYGRKAEQNKGKPLSEQIGLTVQFRTEAGQVVAYVQKIAPKAPKAEVKTEAPAKVAKPKASAKKVSPPKASK